MCCEEYGLLIYERRFNPTHFYLMLEDDTLREMRLSPETKCNSFVKDKNLENLDKDFI